MIPKNGKVLGKYCHFLSKLSKKTSSQLHLNPRFADMAQHQWLPDKAPHSTQFLFRDFAQKNDPRLSATSENVWREQADDDQPQKRQQPEEPQQPQQMPKHRTADMAPHSQLMIVD